MHEDTLMTTKNRFRVSVIAVAIGAAITGLAGCSGGRSAETLTYSGSTTLMPLLSAAAEVYEERNPNVHVDIQGGGTSKGILDLTTGAADLAGAARELTAAERMLVEPIAVARDGLAMIAHDGLPLTGVTLEGLRLLYGGDAAEFDGVPVTRVAKASAHGTAQAFAKGIGVDLADVNSDVVAGSNGEVIAVVTATANAIGYVSHADAEAAIAEGAPIRILAIDGVMPSVETVRNGAYPLVRTLYLALGRRSLQTPERPRPSEKARDFVELIGSPTGTRLILDAGFVPEEG